MVEALKKDIRHLSIHPRPRDSSIASAGEAGDIFDLYGADSGGSGHGNDVRESWRSSTGNGNARSNGGGSGNGIRDSTIGVASDTPSRYVDNGYRGSTSTTSWSGPLNALSGIDPGSHALDDDEKRWSDTTTGNTPDISITQTQEELDEGFALESEQQRRRSKNGLHRDSSDLRKSSLISSTTSSSHPLPPHQHQQQQQQPQQDGSRLSPQKLGNGIKRHSSGRVSDASGNASTNTSISEIGRKSSGHSVAGSSQYPGEEDDAYMVRNTYARLEKEGVHGDGWDQGVERTRGGPSIVSGKRATVYPATKTGDIGEQERQFLASLDRYGFVNEPLRNRSETRLALIPTAPLLKIPKLPNSSPLEGKLAAEPSNSFMPSGDAGPSPRIPPASPTLRASEEDRIRKKEFDRVDKWGRMMSIKRRDSGGNISEWDWSSRLKEKKDKLDRRVYKGIPDRWRMAAWWTLAQEQTEKVARSKGKGRASRSAEDIENDYKNTVELPSTFDVQIDLDVPRTISGHTMFVTRYGAGQRNLWHVLHCFSQVCETCGYVQGMGPIAATLLCYFDPERAYTLLVRLHDVYGMHEIFEPGFPGLLEAFYVQERLMEWLMPDLYQSFQRNMISSSSWGTKWYITLFVNTVPFSQQLRLWDALWLDGRDVMIITSLAILWAFKDILSSPKATFESILSTLSSYFVAEDEDAFMDWIKRVIGQHDIRAKMDEWREEWKRLVEQGKSQSALL
ncbi:uncharacterized protein I303_105789 [Kwoniella dejecticola CBS 10117]|uniref:GTPase activating protein n=1 Tax=Kwoniella dejecticola CBS 10117 TaxID=1296121 RepID=A0A1A6A0G0_9TREE|nr:GTPase activating protein [Kwoniella dejecticola CBS 10117]OBR83531.1 GTPase activating protein [Kwoniella dejecticola CBS 10117]